jgi:hypothetical protein
LMHQNFSWCVKHILQFHTGKANALARGTQYLKFVALQSLKFCCLTMNVSSSCFFNIQNIVSLQKVAFPNRVPRAKRSLPVQYRTHLRQSRVNKAKSILCTAMMVGAYNIPRNFSRARLTPSPVALYKLNLSVNNFKSWNKRLRTLKTILG